MVACNKDEDLPKPSDIHKLIYDKTWYCDDANQQPNNYFNSDGTFIISPNSGNWEWHSNDTLVLTDAVNSTIMVIWFTKIEENKIEYWPTWEPEGTTYKFTTKP